MKKIMLAIAILALALISPISNRLSSAHTHALKAPRALNQELANQTTTTEEFTEEFHQTYPLSPTGVVSIANINGAVHISVWDQTEVKVDAVKRARQRESLSEVTIDVVNTADSVRIKTKYPEYNQASGERNRHNNSASVEYTLTIPRHARLDSVELVNGALNIEGVEGDVRASCVNGAVKATGLAGEVKLQTVNGVVEAVVSRMDQTKSIALNTVNGAIVLTIPAGASADVKASTLHGEITNDFGLTLPQDELVGHNLSGQIGSGGPRVKLNSVNGPISIKRG